jgi:hypothetical protein
MREWSGEHDSSGGGGPEGRARPSDDEILAIARRIRRAAFERPADDPRRDVLSVCHELPPADEARVEAALERLRWGGRRRRLTQR